MSESLVSMLTALGDDELVLGHRHSEWTGFAPHVEEDVAFSSIAQDEIGHSAAHYSLVATVTGDHPDRLALGRSKSEYRHAILCERDNRDWAFTLARHWLYDHADEIRLETLQETAHEDLAALVTKIRREERYHLIHADIWIKRVAHGPAEGRGKLVDAIGEAFDDVMGLFEPFELEEQAVKDGWLPVPSLETGQRFVARMTAALDELGVPSRVPSRSDTGAEFVASSSGDLIAGNGTQEPAELPHDGMGGRRGRRSSDFDSLWDDLTSTYRAHPGASW
ncbi:MAG: phenylacetate-CoA oxygenase subunit PaaC [Actinomycetota bacterium]|nr:phenylacetate-CoA oxygenase subunit PaaC [Actinomycetota bacterium]